MIRNPEKSSTTRGHNNFNSNSSRSTADCSHPAFYNSLCVSCGKKIDIEALKAASKSTNQSTEKIITFTLNGGAQLKLSNEEAERVEQSQLQTLHKLRKLGLILDIDHTLLHATPVQHLPSAAEMKALELDSISVSVDGAGAFHHLIKLRPHLRDFLRRISEKFQLSIYTAGTRAYAESVVRLLDPGGSLFRRRIVSRSDSSDAPSAAGLEKSLARLFVGDSADLAVILDDREDVWKGTQSQQLMLVRPYVYFLGASEVNNASGQQPHAHVQVSLLPPEEVSPSAPTPVAAASPSAGTVTATDNSFPMPAPVASTTTSIDSSINAAPSSSQSQALPSTASGHLHSVISLSAPRPCSLRQVPAGLGGGVYGRVAGYAVSCEAHWDDMLLRAEEVLNLLHKQYYALRDSNRTVTGNSHTNGAIEGDVGQMIAEASEHENHVVNGLHDSNTSVARIDETRTTVRIPTLLGRLRGAVLEGCVVTFSGLIARNDAFPECSTHWRLARSLGAKVTHGVTPETTHLIAAQVQTRTHKISACVERDDVYIVHSDWLLYSRYVLARANEQTFSLIPGVPKYQRQIQSNLGNRSNVEVSSQKSADSDSARPSDNNYDFRRPSNSITDDFLVEEPPIRLSTEGAETKHSGKIEEQAEVPRKRRRVRVSFDGDLVDVVTDRELSNTSPIIVQKSIVRTDPVFDVNDDDLDEDDPESEFGQWQSSIGENDEDDVVDDVSLNLNDAAESSSDEDNDSIFGDDFDSALVGDTVAGP